MPRNGSDGTMALADTVAPATLADANEVMTIFNDLASEMTASLAKDGQTAITGQLKGLVSANPVFSFNGDSNTGLGSDTADELYLMCGGTKIAKLSAAGLDVLSGSLLTGGLQAISTGFCLPYVGATAPAGWILAHGGSIGDASSGATARANADALNLFALIWGAANQSGGIGQVQDSAGTNTARGANAAADFAAHKRILLPDLTDRYPLGAKFGVTSMGDTGGATTATVLRANLPNVSFTNSGIALGDPGHGHGVTDPGHLHGGGQATTKAYAIFGGVGSVWGDAAINTSSAATGLTVNSNTSGITISNQGSAASGGSGTGLDIRPKFIALEYIIKL